jgi:3-hydroxymyristoyl/3-hydroxydecanoyl-(acyl carrier protein) dehydratase
MRYSQLDRIVSLEPGQKIVAERALRAEEEYLLDHFPRFPVMPGVMMLEALFQASMWMVRSVHGEDDPPLVLLREVKSVKFADFLSPGQTLRITAERVKSSEGRVTVKAQGSKVTHGGEAGSGSAAGSGGDRPSVSARLELELRSFDPQDRSVPEASYVLRLMQQKRLALQSAAAAS